MSQQGETPTGRRDEDAYEDDWWGQLYDDTAGDTGPAAAPDSLDDRFASVAGAVGDGTPAGEPGVPAPRPEPGAQAPSAPPAGADWGGFTPRTGAGPRTGTGPRDGAGPAPARDAAAEPEDARPPSDPVGPVPRTGPGGETVSQGRGDTTPEPAPEREAGSVRETAPEPEPGPAPDAGSEWQPAPGRAADGEPPGAGADVTAGRPGGGDEDAAPPPDRETLDLSGGRGGGAVTYVGEEPPSYDPEPTSLPMADPAALEDLVPDTVLDGARYGALTLRAASVRGDSARYRGEVRRDALLTARFGVGDRALVLVAQATGARATPEGQRAATAACRWVGQAVGRSAARLAEDIRESRGADLRAGLQRLTDRTLGRLRAAAAEEGRDPAVDEASLRCLLLPADPDCRTRVFFGVGDGGLLRLRDGAWEDLEPRPAHAPGVKPAELTMDLGIATPPSPYRPAPEPPREPFRFRTCVARPGDRLLMCGAGLAEPLAGEPALLAHLGRRWSALEPPGVADFLADVRVRVKGYADDRTAVAVWEA